MKPYLVVVITAICGSFTISAFAEPTPETADTLKAKLVGNTDCGVNPSNGYETCIYFTPDGMLSGISAGQYRSKGNYEINPDGTLCTHWKDPKWEGSCTKRYPQASGEIHAIDGAGNVKFKATQTLQGNPKKL